ncbi:hypothetical protein CPC08DRAFT_820448 [Agrocybe pediades]|nr:hypothetical protein CPC08DRAFT_820448 [Agrocybe pediades]
MKRLFGHKPKNGKFASGSRDFAEDNVKAPIPTPLYQKLATHGNHLQAADPPQPPPSADEERWEVVAPQNENVYLPNPHPLHPIVKGPSRTSSFGSIPPNNASVPLASPHPQPRSVSPMSSVTNIQTSNKLIRHHAREREAQLQAANGKKKVQTSAPVAMGILRALDPPRSDGTMIRTRSDSEERRTVSDNGHREFVPEKKEKRGFWGGKDKDKEKERERQREMEFHARDRVQETERGRELRKEDDSHAELTRMIGYLTATASEDWTLVLEVCDRASASEGHAKEAVRALRREFKYGEPPAQLSAARLWAIMLRNSSDMFISQSTSRKFLDTIEDLLSSSRTSPVVRERLLEIVAAAAYASGNKKGHERDGFKGLWKRVKPYDKPDEGVPFDTDDAMFNPPTANSRVSGYEIPIVSYQEPSPLPLDSAPLTPTPNPVKKRKSPTRNRIIPPDEDMRRLFQECKIGQGNASLLSQALIAARPEDLKKQDIIKEFYVKCRASQELIFAQIPWASAGAERSIEHRKTHSRKRTISNDLNLSVRDVAEAEDSTIEEKLLAALLAANAELMEAIKQHDDLERVAMERKAESRSRKETRMDPKQRANLLSESAAVASSDGHVGGSSRSPSPSSRPPSPRPPVSLHTRPHHLNLSEAGSEVDLNTVGGQNLAPPPAAPHGPRSPAPVSVANQSRTPSPGTPVLEPPYTNGIGYAYGDRDRDDSLSMYASDEDEHLPPKPSAKALGKRKVVEPEEPVGSVPLGGDGDSTYFTRDQPPFGASGHDPELDEEEENVVLTPFRRPPVKFVYDAVAERTKQWQAGLEPITTNGTH